MDSLISADEEDKSKLLNFKNINGEGVCATVGFDGHEFEVLLGNEKLMKRNNVNLTYNRLDENMSELESLGKTVVIFAINNTGRLLISLEEEHLAKQDS